MPVESCSVTCTATYECKTDEADNSSVLDVLVAVTVTTIDGRRWQTRTDLELYPVEE